MLIFFWGLQILWTCESLLDNTWQCKKQGSSHLGIPCSNVVAVGSIVHLSTLIHWNCHLLCIDICSIYLHHWSKKPAQLLKHFNTATMLPCCWLSHTSSCPQVHTCCLWNANCTSNRQDFWMLLKKCLILYALFKHVLSNTFLDLQIESTSCSKWCKSVES